MKMKSCLFLVLIGICTTALGQERTRILLIGTFHFSNPGKDVVQTKKMDILSEKPQKELDEMAQKIKDFKPSKFFVEFDYRKQSRLDSLYEHYLKDVHTDFIRNSRPHDLTYPENELFQLAFRAGKGIGLKNMCAVDYKQTVFPYGDLIEAIDKAGQKEVKEANSEWESKINAAEKRQEQMSISQRILFLNTAEQRRLNRNWYISTANRGGGKDQFTGAYLNSEWYKRNLYILSLIQKMTTKDDKKVVVLLGAGHISLIEQFLKDDDRFEITELRDLP